jgi:hypothetical protein
MKSCNRCCCYHVCKVVHDEVLKKFSKPGSLDELEAFWQELASKCESYLDKEEVARYKKKSPP